MLSTYDIITSWGFYNDEQLKQIANERQITLKDAIVQSGLNYNNMINKFQRDTIRLSEVEKILDVLGKEIRIVDKHE